MLNQVVLVGRITKELEVENLEGNKKVGVMALAIPRTFKNSEGEYETDFINIQLWDSVAENVKEYCRKGDIVGVKGRLQSREIEKYHTKMTITEVIAEKVTFLSSRKESEEE